MFAFFSVLKSISQISKQQMELTSYFIDILGALSDYLTGQSRLFFSVTFLYFPLLAFEKLCAK